MPDGRKATIAIDVVATPNAGVKAKSIVKDLEREAARASKDSLEHAVRNAKAETRAKEEEARRQKKITDDLLNYKIRNAKEEAAKKKAAADSFLAAVRRDAQQEITENRKKLAQIDAAEKRFYTERNRRARQSADDFLKTLKTVQSSEAVRGPRSIAGGVFLGSLAAQGLTALTSQLSTAGRAVFDFSAKMQQSQVSFRSLMGNARLASSHIKDLQELTVKFPLDFSSIAMMSQRLQGAGIEARRVIPLIKDIGNVAAATGDLGAERMEGLAVALSQVASKGIVSAEEMEQLAERGVPAWKMLSDSIGKTIAETRKMAEDGEITADTLFKAFEKMSRVNFAGAMESQARTFGGAMKQIENVLLLTANEAFKPFMDKITTLASRSSDEIKKQNGDWNRIGFTIGGALGEGISAAVGEAIRKLPAIIAGAVVGIGKGVWDVGGNLGGDAAGLLLKTLGFDDRRVNIAVARAKETFLGTPNPYNLTSRALPGTLPNRTPSAPLGSSIGRPSMSQLTDIFGGATPSSGSVDQKALQKLNQEIADLEKLKARASGKGLLNIESQLAKRRQIAMYVEQGASLSAARSAMTGGGRLPKTKSSKVNLNLKDEMSDALEITAKYGAVVTSGREGKHNTGSSHPSGGAFDVRTAGLSDAQVRALISAYHEAGYSVRDERVRPQGQRVWGGPHLHVGGRTGGSRSAGGSFVTAASINQNITAYLRDLSDAETRAWEDSLVDGFLSTYVKSGLIPSDGMIEKITQRAKELAQAEGIRQPSQAELVNELALIKLNAVGIRTPSVSADSATLGTVADLTRQPLETMPENPLVKDSREAMYEVWRRWDERRREAFEDARDAWNDLLTDLANGDFKSIWRNLKNQMLQQFIQPASQYLAQLFGNPFGGGGGFGGMQPAMAGGGFGGLNLGGLFGGGRMGPGGTPMFNPNMNFAGSQAMGGGGFGGIGSIFGGLFGRGGGGGSMPMSHEAGHLGGGFGKGGIMGKLGGMSGIAGLIGAGMTMAGGAIGGKWGNTLSLAGTGAMLGLQFGGPWGALIGGAIGGAVGLFSMLFGRDNSEKKLKESALRIYGITVKDKSVLKSLKKLGETMFGKRVGENADAVVQSDEGQLILRNYAEATNQSSEKMDRLYVGDENWKGNQFRTKFGGFRAMGGPVMAGTSYIVGERRPEVFTPSQNGYISPSIGAGMMNDEVAKRVLVVLGQMEETNHMLATKLQSLSPGQVVAMGAEENPDAIGKALRTDNSTSLLGGEKFQRSVGAYG